MNPSKTATQVLKLIAAFCLPFILGQFNARAQVSNRIPLQLLKEYMNQGGQWTKDMEDSNQPAGSNILQFLGYLQSANAAPQAVESLVGKTNSDFSQTQPLYAIKVHLIRHFLAHAGDRKKYNVELAHVEKVESLFMRRYVESSVALLQLAQVKEYKPILDNLLKSLNERSLRIVDLSPANRLKFHQEWGSSHGLSLVSHENFVYQIDGVYSEKQKILGIDFLRPFQETLITFAHEIVHAADPMIASYRQRLVQLLPKVESIISGTLGGLPQSLAQSILQQVFFEVGQSELLVFAQKAKQALAQRLLRESREIDENISEENKQIIKTWLQTVIGLTIGNEYKAYGLSLVVYERLRHDFQLIQPSRSRNRYIETIIRGDSGFANSLSDRMNPFSRRLEYYQTMVKQFRLEGSLKIRVDFLISYLESVYLNETREFLEGTSNQFSSILNASYRPWSAESQAVTKSQTLSSDRKSIELPEWTKPGQFDSPTNPYAVLSALVTTSQILRFRDNLNKNINKLKDTSESLFTLRAGILDLHDLTLGEMKLLGVHFLESNQSSLSPNLPPEILSDMEQLPSRLKSYFQITKWEPGLTSSDNTISGHEFIQQLLRLRLLKGLAWFDEMFPNVKSNILSMKITLQKLHDGLYDKEELGPERASELQEELVQAIEYSALTADEITNLTMITELMFNMHQVSSELKWQEAMEQFSRKASQSLRILESFGLPKSKFEKTFQSNLSKELQSFASQLVPFIAECRGVFGMIPMTLGRKFSIAGSSFPLSAICYKTQLYLIRQPGDITGTISSMVRGGRLLSRLASGSRFIELVPFEQFGGSR